MPRETWSWKPAGVDARPAAGMRYEPGNPGDLLKHAWMLALLGKLVDAAPAAGLHVLDPFAGRAQYPLSPRARQRIEALPAGALRSALAPFVEREQLPSTGRLALAEAARRGRSLALAVFDIDGGALATWDGVPGARRLAAAGGLEILRGAEARSADAIIVDPYDLFDHWKEILDAALRLAPERPVLAYLYDKSPRGPGHAEQYAALRRFIDLGLERSGAAGALGRVPSDAVQPRAFHEVLLLGPKPVFDAVAEDLRQQSTLLAGPPGPSGCFESLGGNA
jgi:hypothetical protein